MTKDGMIVDTSVWIAFFRGKQPFAGELSTLVEAGQVYITGIVTAEILQGIKSLQERERISEAITVVPDLEITNQIWAKTGLMSATLRQQGITLPLTDTALAVLALEHNLSLFTLDKHFESIPGVKLYRP